MTDHSAGKDKVNFERTKFWVTTALTIVAVVVGLTEYAATNFYTVRSPFLEMQANLCKSASDAAARVATTAVSDSLKDDWLKARNEFWTIYWGPLVIVEDVDIRRNDNNCIKAEATETAVALTDEVKKKFPVTSAMVQFGHELGSMRVPPEDDKAVKLAEDAFLIAQACQKSIRSVWNIGIWQWLTAPFGWGVASR